MEFLGGTKLYEQSDLKLKVEFLMTKKGSDVKTNLNGKEGFQGNFDKPDPNSFELPISF